MQRKTLLVLTIALLLAMSFASSLMAQEFEPNIVDIAAADDRFETLHTAIVAAGLADTLASADNTFTVFAPTDDAFAAVGEDVLNALLADPEGALTQVLLYHVAAGELQSGDVLASATVPTLQGESLDVSLRDGLPFVNDSQIIITDIPAKNGVIHVIDAVLVPDAIANPTPPAMEEPEMSEPTESPDEEMDVTANMPAAEMESEAAGQTIAEIAVANGNFNTLLTALSAAGLADTFAQPGDYTVFAPTDAAFAAVPEATLNRLLADPQGELTDVLLFHVVGDSLTRDQLATSELVPTLDGRPLQINTDGSNIVDINGATVLMYNIEASNGIIHVIDTVLIP
jgi:transforming growth factor-beta-induced protein